MANANHPNVVPAAPKGVPQVKKPAPVVKKEASTEISTADKVKMQADDAAPGNTDGPVTLTTAPVVSAAPSDAANVYGLPGPFHRLQLNLGITLCLTSPEQYAGLRKSLPTMTWREKLVSLYSPFRKKKTSNEQFPVEEGLVRLLMPRILNTVEEVNNNNILLVPAKGAKGNADIQNVLKDTVESVSTKVAEILPEVKVDLATTDLAATPRSLTTADLTSVNSWITVAQDGEVATHIGVINLQVQSPELYDADEKLKSVGRIYTALQNILKHDQIESEILLAINISSAMLADLSIRDLVNDLFAAGDWQFLTRNQLYAGTDMPWIPTTKAAIDKALLHADADMLFFTTVDLEDQAAPDEPQIKE